MDVIEVDGNEEEDHEEDERHEDDFYDSPSEDKGEYVRKKIQADIVHENVLELGS